MTAARDVCGIGNAVVDIIVQVDEQLLQQWRLTKGAMELARRGRMQKFLDTILEGRRCSGGSAANTMANLAALGASVAYVGKVHDDELGRLFSEDLERCGVPLIVVPARRAPPTGCCLVFVSSDAERTMLTYLGASATLAEDDLNLEEIRNCRLLYLEGYLYDRAPARRAMERAAREAGAAGAQVAVSLSDSFCVRRHRAHFCRLLKEQAQVVFGNAAEICTLAEEDNLEKAARLVGERCPLVVATCGAQGALLVEAGRLRRLPAQPAVKVVDTTGAGDAYAAGFLFGLSRGWPVENCARLAAAVAAEIIGQVGARATRPLTDLVARNAPDGA